MGYLNSEYKPVFQMSKSPCFGVNNRMVSCLSAFRTSDEVWHGFHAANFGEVDMSHPVPQQQPGLRSPIMAACDELQEIRPRYDGRWTITDSQANSMVGSRAERPGPRRMGERKVGMNEIQGDPCQEQVSVSEDQMKMTYMKKKKSKMALEIEVSKNQKGKTDPQQDSSIQQRSTPSALGNDSKTDTLMKLQIIEMPTIVKRKKKKTKKNPKTESQLRKGDYGDKKRKLSCHQKCKEAYETENYFASMKGKLASILFTPISQNMFSKHRSQVMLKGALINRSQSKPNIETVGQNHEELLFFAEFSQETRSHQLQEWRDRRV